jgi:hypothetical protein
MFVVLNLLRSDSYISNVMTMINTNYYGSRTSTNNISWSVVQFYLFMYYLTCTLLHAITKLLGN